MELEPEEWMDLEELMCADIAPNVSELEELNDLEKPGKRFQFNGKKLHLTYRGHIPLEELLAHLQTTLGVMKWYSIVHESGSSHGTLGYAHTHAALELRKTAVFTSARKLDYQGVHPHLKSIKTDQQALNVWKYHEKAPLAILRSDTGPGIVRSESFMQELIAAPSLIAAAKLAGVEVKSLRDVQILRQDRSVRQHIPKLEDACSWRMMLVGSFRTVYISGPSGIGKTQWALAQFECPCLVSNLEDLKQFLPGHHDGLVFDDFTMSSMPSNAVIHLVDWDLPRTINVKYGSVTIPAFTRKIFTSNIKPQEAIRMFCDEHQSPIMRRLTVYREEQSLFITKKQNSENSNGEQNVCVVAPVGVL